MILLYKPKLLTPLEAIVRLKNEHLEYAASKISYAGRLDPMAEGLMLLLVDKENKKRNEYESFPKTYSFSILFGVSTDTADPLGIIKRTDNSLIDLEATLPPAIKAQVGESDQKYPAYSSKAIKGKPLYHWARKNELKEEDIPSITIEVKDLTLTEIKKVSSDILIPEIISNIKKVTGDFRQEPIIKVWENLLADNSFASFQIASFTTSVTSGTYIRSLAERIGKEIGIPSLAYSIIRTDIGPYNVSDSIRLISNE